MLFLLHRFDGGDLRSGAVSEDSGTARCSRRETKANGLSGPVNGRKAKIKKAAETIFEFRQGFWIQIKGFSNKFKLNLN
jgi:hypothetical protein